MTVQEPVPSPVETFRLIYRSIDLTPVDRRKVALGELFSQARSNNKERDMRRLRNKKG